ncbi:hypothetical protein GCM10007981_04630 [Thermocladium modestius]|uniref:Uncharacterized protein n=1 Tax=Thermocladium modestius TaxID=62609 RepID=A0A830GWL2_9CREN|nr:hypothetical protein [Thermocladium modestius]GGP19737.1 hypothetical protein GCM10007981_04630 [Thermocladium modestius]
MLPVDSEKKPLTSWGADRRLELDELMGLLGSASGIAVVGRKLWNEGNTEYGVIIIDVDDVDVGNNVLTQVFGDDWRRRLCG